MHSKLGLLAGVATLVVAKPEQIRAVSSPIFHYYLQASPQNGMSSVCLVYSPVCTCPVLWPASIPVMGPESSSEYFTIDSGSIQSTNTSAYLAIGSDSTSYKTLTLSSTASAPGWALEGDTIITGTSSTWGRQLNFLVCQMGSADYWRVYLQTGSDTPSGSSCSNYQSLHLPCLC
ncbi:hypothetical protein GGR57DRAFT_79268 [Xylariaceae sp. FL1272]|nr:hypothetical protein GGR57DRAFT_79268 [Xylariaceae sp. FL1272]